MKAPKFLQLLVGSVLALHLVPWLRADVAVPARVLHPETPAEAWNVIRLATANVDRLLAENRLAEVPVQISLCSPALRLLGRMGEGTEPERRARFAAPAVRGSAAITSIAQAAMVGDDAATLEAFSVLRGVLRDLGREFEAGLVGGEIFLCPMHPEFVSADPRTLCDLCGMDLVPRRIPHSFIYVPPGEPSLVLTAKADGPLTAGREVGVKIQLLRRDGSAVRPEDLIVTHTQPIHLLIVDPSLEDYHHEHPIATASPGEYAFSFTPARNGSYRIFADLLPANTAVQEYAMTDLPGAVGGTSVVVSASTFTSTAGGLRFDLNFEGGNGVAPQARKVLNMRVSVADRAEKPVQSLQPVMNAFAHMVGFYDDYRTVVHLHPAGGEIFQAEARGGPSMAFRFYPPKPGFIRLYCQVLVRREDGLRPLQFECFPLTWEGTLVEAERLHPSAFGRLCRDGSICRRNRRGRHIDFLEIHRQPANNGCIFRDEQRLAGGVGHERRVEVRRDVTLEEMLHVGRIAMPEQEDKRHDPGPGRQVFQLGKHRYARTPCVLGKPEHDHLSRPAIDQHKPVQEQRILDQRDQG